MASIRERTRKNGTVYWSVLWRDRGRQTSFSVTDRAEAEYIRAYLAMSGGALPPDATRNDTITRYRLLVRVLATTGLRAGAAYALRVGDVSTRASTITVEGAPKRDGKGGRYIGTAKTARSHRVVLIPAGCSRTSPLLDIPSAAPC
ncbi:MAG: hypothetical protein ACK5MR_04225 [Cumulibacter sp.]